MSRCGLTTACDCSGGQGGLPQLAGYWGSAGEEQEVMSGGQGKLALAQGGSASLKLGVNDIQGKRSWATIAAWSCESLRSGIGTPKEGRGQ